jgi:hypothetical protein
MPLGNMALPLDGDLGFLNLMTGFDSLLGY